MFEFLRRVSTPPSDLMGIIHYVRGGGAPSWR